MKETKKCSKCQIEKPRTDFYRQGEWWMGKCKECYNEIRAWKDPWGEGMKGCGKCGQVKELAAFDNEVRNTGSKGKGVASACKECRRPVEKAWRQDNAEYVTSYQRDYNKANVRRQTIQKFVYKTKIPFTLEQYEALHAAQNGVCKICHKPQNGKSLAIDHCYTTHKVRGLLCESCNRGIGCLQDDPALLRSAILYLEEQV
jgi:hypothetical protein